MNKKYSNTLGVKGKKKFRMSRVYYRRQLYIYIYMLRVRSSMWFFLFSISAPTTFLKPPYIIIMSSVAAALMGDENEAGMLMSFFTSGPSTKCF